MARKKKRTGDGRANLISGREDMAWLRDVHLPKLSSKFKSAMIYGNEDCPRKVAVYRSENPSITSNPIVFRTKKGSCKLKRR
jgi:hypothetical protein